MNTYYEDLDIGINSNSTEIKNAYKKMVRLHNPQKEPEGFKRIRKAYEILSDPKSKASYDAMLRYKDEIEEYREQGLEALNNKQFDKAIKYFKKILLIEPSLTFARNQLGIAYYYNGDYDMAIKQYKQCIKEDDENAIYHSNLGLVYRDTELYEKAEAEYKRAYKLNPLNPDTIIDIAEVRYYHLNNYEGAVQILKDAIKYDNNVDFEDFHYFFKLIEINVFAKKNTEIQELIKEIEGIVPNDEETLEYVAFKFAELSKTFYEIKLFELSNKVAVIAKKFLPDNDFINDLIKFSDEWEKLHNSFSFLKDDDRVLDALKLPFLYYIYAEEIQKENGYSDEELKEKWNQHFEVILSYINGDPQTVVDSINIIKTHYYYLYNSQKEYIDKIYLDADKRNILLKQFDEFSKDNRNNNGLKRLIALWVSNDDFSEKEREDFLNNIEEEIYNSNIGVLLATINRIRNYYSLLYNLNPDALKELETTLKNFSKSAVSSSTSSSGACFVATAAFGSPWVKEIILLRKWRDTTLRQRRLGRVFIALYYTIGPYAAKLVERSNTLKGISRFIIYKILNRLKTKGLNM